MIRFLTFMSLPRLFGRTGPKLRNLIIPGVLSAIVAMLGFQAIQGERGYLSLFGLEQERLRTAAELKALQHENDLLMRDISLLSGDKPNLDFLDERARIVLGFVKSNDTVLILR
ncbi:MAG: FtsB family cell division protein [Parvibaculales bacterium]